MADLDLAGELGAKESGLAVAITLRADGTPRASVVNAGVIVHPVSGERVVAFVSSGPVRKLADLRRDNRTTVVFRSGWEWVAVAGEATLAGPDDPMNGLDESDLLQLIRTVYAAAVGGTPDQWSQLDEAMAAERHTAVLVRPVRIYPAAEQSSDKT